MHTAEGTRQIIRWVALGALFLVPLTPLIVANSYFFPFITGKAFFFRTIVEVAVVVWVVLACIDREYRPRYSRIGAAVVLFVSWMFIADLFALNVTKAFWSNFERMEGWVLLAHLLGFFFAASNVLRVDKQWRAWFLTSLGVSIVVVLHALGQLAGIAEIHQGSTRIDASFGNSAYLAIYLLFNVFIALWIALTERRVWLKWALLGLALVQGGLIFFTETRGAIIGLVGALALAALLTAFTAGKHARQLAFAGLAVLILAAGGIYAAKDTSFVENNRVLNRVTSISLEDGKTRFTIWSMALKGVQERPITGWGQEGFNYVFNTYYEPSLYGQESWFDRAHDVYLDWATAGGVPALVLYLALFGIAVFLLWSHSELSRPERVALTAALAGYAFHNLFVFDNLYSYVYFFAILALIDSQVGQPTKLQAYPEISRRDASTYAVPIATVVALALIWTVNVSGMRKASMIITALSPQPEGPLANLRAYEELLASQGFGVQEIREQLVSFALRTAQDTKVPEEVRGRIIARAVQEMEQHVSRYPRDARSRLQFAYAYRAAGDHARSLEQVLLAKELSPRKPEMWLEAGVAAWTAGDNKAAQTYFAGAQALYPSAAVLAEYAAAGHIAMGEVAKARALLLDAYGTTTVDSDILGAAYYRTKDWRSFIQLYQLRTMQPEATVQTWFELVAAQYTAGDYNGAIRTLRTVAERYPEARAQAEAGIRQIQTGQ